MNKDLFEQAALLSQMFQSHDQAGTNDGMVMMSKMLKMMEIVEMMQALQQPPAPSADGAAVDGVKLFDEDTQVPGLKAVKSAIPYLEPRYRKNLGLMIKLIEIHKLIETYGYSAMHTHGGPAAANQKDWRREMLTAVRPHVAPQRQQMTDLLIKCMDMTEIIKKVEALKHAGQP